jgi:hypothetical protein
MFAFVGRNSPPPQGAAPAPLWGNPVLIAERLGDRFGAPHHFDNVMHQEYLLTHAQAA